MMSTLIHLQMLQCRMYKQLMPQLLLTLTLNRHPSGDELAQ